jgi:transcriptional regulator with XRE-family HTH domain
MNLLQRTYELMKSSGLTRDEIAQGADVDISWLNKFAQKRIPSPGVNKVQAVHDFLSRPRRRSRDHAA